LDAHTLTLLHSSPAMPKRKKSGGRKKGGSKKKNTRKGAGGAGAGGNGNGTRNGTNGNGTPPPSSSPPPRQLLHTSFPPPPPPPVPPVPMGALVAAAPPALPSNVTSGGGWAVADEAGKGRVLKLTRGFRAGAVLFRERPLVAASWKEHRCMCCGEIHPTQSCTVAKSAFAPRVLARLGDIATGLSELYGIDELDRARTFIMALRLAATVPRLRERLLSLCQANLGKCVACVDIIQENALLRQILPPNLPARDCARILSALNTNSHELEHWGGGSGLFPEAGAMCEHSCRPNCVFNTSKGELFVVAIRDLVAGESVSIDYVNAFYEPREGRREQLQDAYDFYCRCDHCVSGTDVVRAYMCTKCGTGRVCPTPDEGGVGAAANSGGVGTAQPASASGAMASASSAIAAAMASGDLLDSDFDSDDEDLDLDDDDNEVAVESIPETWQCLSCGWVMPVRRRQVCDAIEQAFGDSEPPATEEALDAVLAQKVFHESHHLIWGSLVNLGECFAGNPSRCRDGSAVRVWKRVIRTARNVLPPVHPHWVVLEDSLAQVYVSAASAGGTASQTENVAEASAAFRRAYEMSRRCSGGDTDAALLLKRLADKTPRTVEELMLFYDNAEDRIETLKADGMNEEAERLQVQRNEAVGMDVDED
jgi:hypothetical protein